MTFAGQTYIPELDRERLTSQLERVMGFMSSGEWHTLREIVAAVGGSEASVSARLRDCRKTAFGGFAILRRRRGEPKSGLHEYRLLAPTKNGQAELPI